MTLSIVIPAHNAAGTIAKTLESVLAQTRGDWQAIVVDDGSTDDTRQVVQDHAARDKRVQLLTHQASAEGVSAARNHGIAASTGRWLLFLDADDCIEPSFVERMLGRLEAVPGAKVAYCGSRRVTATGRRGPAWFSTAVARAPFETLARSCPIVVHGVVLERALVVGQGGFDVSLRTAEDMDFFQRIARTGVAFLPVPEPLALYHMRRGSLSTDMRTMLADRTRVIERAFDAGAQLATGTKEMAIAEFALWCAAADIGQGGRGDDLLKALPGGRSDLVELCRQTIVEGLAFGAQRLSDELPHDDPAFVERVRALLDDVERAAGRPGLARLLQFALEPEVFSPQRVTDRLAVDGTLLVRQDLARLAPIAVDAGIDRVCVEFRSGARMVGHGEVPALGGLSLHDVTRLALASVSLAELLKSAGLLHQPAFWLHATAAAVRLGPSMVAAKLRYREIRGRTLRAFAKAVLGDAALATAGAAGTSDRAIAALIAEGRAMAERTAPAGKARPAEPTWAIGEDRRAHWEGLYRTEDPWAYGSDYEQLKYRRTLDLLPDRPIGKAMELACSEGRFTELLAPRVGHLLAADISDTALQRARRRCSSHGNVEWRRLDLFDDPLPDGLDLIVCSEVLYNLADRTALARVAQRLAASLAPGGHLLCAHAFVLKDDPARTGFDWNATFGAKVIAETLSATPGLALERSLHDELYRINLFRRLAAGEISPVPHIEQAEPGPPPEPRFARHIVWHGAIARRADVRQRERTDRLPVLLYHRIAEDGSADLARYRQAPAAFAEQMRWLRRNGYHAVTADDVVRHLADGRPFAGRPVLISFDDGYCDFHDAAWPILHAHDFTAEIFVVTDKVGGRADWDAAYGTPAPLMGWPQIQELAAAGVRFGSHMASHSHMAELSSREIVLEAARSRAALERALGMECRSIAAPFGEGDERFVHVARQCGYASGFTIDPGHAALGQDPLRLPRIEVIGGWSIETFVEAVQGA